MNFTVKLEILMMKQEKLTKIVFFAGYNYHIRYYNIKRKIENLEEDSKKLQKIINNNHKPIKFKEGYINKDGKKIAEIKKIHVKLSTPINNTSPLTTTLHASSIPYNQEAKYYLMVEIFSEATQYCADLASIILGLKDFKTEKSTYSQIKDAKIREWYKDINSPSFEEFTEIFNLCSPNILTPEERFKLRLKYENLKWQLIKIGNFYWYNYNYLYTPFRHGMKGSFWKDHDSRVYFRTFTNDKKFNMYYLSDNRIQECLEIIDKIYSIFHDQIQVLLISKALSPNLSKINLSIPKAPNIPNIEYNMKEILDFFPNLVHLNINHFKTNEISLIHKFSKEHGNFNFQYIKKSKGTSLFKINGKIYYLDELFSYSQSINKESFIFINNSKIALFLELLHISIKLDHNNSFIIEQIRDLIFNFLGVEKSLIPPTSDFNKINLRTSQLRALVNEILEDFIILFSFYYYEEIFEKIKFSNEEITYLIYYFEKKIIKILNRKSYMELSVPDMILNVLILILILNFLNQIEKIKYFVVILKIKDIENFLSKSSQLISSSIKEEINYDGILELFNFLCDTTNIIDM